MEMEAHVENVQENGGAVDENVAPLVKRAKLDDLEKELANGIEQEEVEQHMDGSEGLLQAENVVVDLVLDKGDNIGTGDVVSTVVTVGEQADVVSSNQENVNALMNDGYDVNPVLRLARISPNAKMPVFGSTGAVGMDLFASEDAAIAAKSRALVSTGLRMAIPVGFYGRIAPRSGLAVKFGLDVGAGVIDPDYRGELKVLLFNFGEEPYEVKTGERIAQMILERCAIPALVEVSEEHLGTTERGVGGFGSSGSA